MFIPARKGSARIALHTLLAIGDYVKRFKKHNEDIKYYSCKN